MTETLAPTTHPEANGAPGAIPMAKRGGPKGLLPGTWVSRTLKVEYTDAFGNGQATTGTLLDLYPAGPVLNIAGARVLLCWDRLCLCELVEDR